MQRRFLTGTVTLVLAALAATLPAYAQQAGTQADAEPEIPRYAVEIILFRYGSSVAAGNELFLPDAPPADTLAELTDDGIPEFGDPVTTGVTEADAPTELGEVLLPAVNVNLATTPRNELLLGDVYSQLQRLDAYEPVLWTGWTQDAVERDVSPVIPLRRLGIPPPGFDGSLQLYLNRFLHLVVDLTMSERQAAAIPAASDRVVQPRNDAFNSWSPVVRMQINEDRIMKNGDLRYFDHPKFGMLATVTRLEKPAEDGALPGSNGTPAQ